MLQRDRLLSWLLPVVLIAVALTQITLAHTRDLTPWKGGGFGMFASVDLLSYRPINAAFDTDEGPVPLDIHEFRTSSDVSSKLYTNARGLPDERRLRQLVDVIGRAEWTINDEGIAEFHTWLAEDVDGPIVSRLADGPEQLLEVAGIDLRVWKVTYDRDHEQVIPELITETRFEFAGRAAFTPPTPGAGP